MTRVELAAAAAVTAYLFVAIAVDLTLVVVPSVAAAIASILTLGFTRSDRPP